MIAKKLILAVDDTATNIDIVKGVLGGQYTIMAALNGAIALKILDQQKPDLILLDIMMPDMDGYEVCERIKANPDLRDIPIIFLTAKAEVSDEAKGLALGAVDYITKPISPPIMIERVKNHLMLQEAKDVLASQNHALEEKVAQRTRQLEELQDVAMVAMGALAETRDPETGNHIRRTQHYIRVLAEHLRTNPRFSACLTTENIALICKSAPLHDIGKVGIPDSILLKPGKLTEAEFEVMKLHPEYGKDAVEAAICSLHETSQHFLTFATEIIYSHHEKWDGGGYPQGLAGDDIPISARLMALADVYDALISRRVYKPPFPHEKAVSIIKDGEGCHFDPDIVAAFLACEAQFVRIAEQYADTQEEVEEAANKLHFDE